MVVKNDTQNQETRTRMSKLGEKSDSELKVLQELCHTVYIGTTGMHASSNYTRRKLLVNKCLFLNELKVVRKLQQSMFSHKKYVFVLIYTNGTVWEEILKG